MKEADVLEIFKKSGALMEGHFLLTSGLHSGTYWEKFHVLQYPEYTSKLCGMIAHHFKGDNVEVVAGPTTGGVILAFETARQMGIRSIFAEKDATGKRSFRRGFSIEPGEKVLIVDDIMTTGGSIFEVIDAVNRLKGNIIGIGILVDRSEREIALGAPLYSCLKSETETYDPEKCPLCERKIPLVRMGG